MIASLGGSAFQTVVDNPVTAYRQLVQQYAKGLDGKAVDPAIARAEANAVFKNAPVSASLSGLVPRLIGVGFKRVPKFGILLGVSYFLEEGGNVGYTAATAASIFSAPFINPIRMIEKQQRAFYKTTGVEKPIKEILKEVRRRTFRVSGFVFSRQEKEPLSNPVFSFSRRSAFCYSTPHSPLRRTSGLSSAELSPSWATPSPPPPLASSASRSSRSGSRSSSPHPPSAQSSEPSPPV